MPLVPMTEFLPRAKKEGFAVGQFNMNNLEFVQGIAAAAKEEKSPFIFGVSEGAMRYMGLEYVVAMANIAAEEAGVPVALHLDHGSSFEVAMKCIQAGSSSVMFDGSHHPFEETSVSPRKSSKWPDAVGVSVEGELGTIGGVEDDVQVDEAEAALAKPEEAIRFWEETGVDAMAIAVGTAHGMYKGEPKIRFDIIEKVADNIDAPIVLHGGSGVPDQAIQDSIRLGVANHVNTESQVACTRVVRELLDSKPDMIDPRKYLGPGREAIQATVQAKMRLFGSSGKA